MKKAQDLVRAWAWSGSTMRMIYAGNRRRFGIDPRGCYLLRVLAQSVGKTPSLGLLGAGDGVGFGVAFALSIFVIMVISVSIYKNRLKLHFSIVDSAGCYGMSMLRIAQLIRSHQTRRP